MMHPNHKLHTRLQLIKRLLNTPNCELIVKCALSLSDYHHSSQSNVYTNTKLAFYLNSLMNSNLSDQNNDKEILNHLNHVLVNSGLNYKNELNSYLSNYQKNNLLMHSNSNGNSGDFSDLTEPSYLVFSVNMVAAMNKRTAVDVMNQFDKELDDQRVNHVYRRANDAFKHFLGQFDRLTNELNVFSIGLLNQVIVI